MSVYSADNTRTLLTFIFRNLIADLGQEEFDNYRENYENDVIPNAQDFALPQVPGPESSWRWKAAWIHFITPRDFNHFTNEFLKVISCIFYVFILFF